jgi:hypothetical protein
MRASSCSSSESATIFSKTWLTLTTRSVHRSRSYHCSGNPQCCLLLATETIVHPGYNLRNDLVVVLAKVQTIARPGVKVILHVHAATNALSSAYRPVLLERPCAIDRRLVGAGRNRDIVCAAISLEAALALRTTAGVVGAVGFDDIVLDKGIASPAVDGKIAVTLRVEGAAVVDGANQESAFKDILQRTFDSHRPLPGFHPFPPTKLPVLRHVTEYLLPSPIVYTAEPPPSDHQE